MQGCTRGVLEPQRLLPLLLLLLPTGPWLPRAAAAAGRRQQQQQRRQRRLERHLLLLLLLLLWVDRSQ
jgi:hypothetical protein